MQGAGCRVQGVLALEEGDAKGLALSVLPSLSVSLSLYLSLSLCLSLTHLLTHSLTPDAPQIKLVTHCLHTTSLGEYVPMMIDEAEKYFDKSIPIPYTLHPAPYTLHPAPYTLHPEPYTLHPTPYTPPPTPACTRRRSGSTSR